VHRQKLTIIIIVSNISIIRIHHLAHIELIFIVVVVAVAIAFASGIA
jgi:hypothetical protein